MEFLTSKVPTRDTVGIRQRAAASGLWARIESTAGVCGGEARVAKTRIPVWSLEALRRQGVTDESLLLDYPGLQRGDLEAVWAYTLANVEEIEAEMAEHEAE